MKSYSIENIRIQDILLISICILLFLNRAVPIDYSSIWRVTVLCLIYTCIRIMPKRQCYCLLYIVCIWGITEVIISTLQKVNYLESNHHDFGITGTFGNPGPLGGLLAVCWIVSISFIYENIQNKHRTSSTCNISVKYVSDRFRTFFVNRQRLCYYIVIISKIGRASCRERV